jgi:hypothetical protein
MAKKKATTKRAKAVKKTTKPAIGRKKAKVATKKSGAKSKTASPKEGQARALTCDWKIPSFSAVCAPDSYSPTFSYTRTNPQDAMVQILYGPTPQGPFNNAVSDVANFDDGHADCSGNPTPPWTTFDTISVGYTARLQLLLNNVVKAKRDTQVAPGSRRAAKKA